MLENENENITENTPVVPTPETSVAPEQQVAPKQQSVPEQQVASPSESPNKTAVAFPNPLILLEATKQVLKGYTVNGFRMAFTTSNFWLLGLVFFPVVAGLMTTNFLWRTFANIGFGVGTLMSGVTANLAQVGLGHYGNQLSESIDSLFSYGFANWIGNFFLYAIIALVALLFRALAVKIAWQRRSIKMPYTASLSVVTLAYSCIAIVAVVSAILWFVPLGFTFGLGFIWLVILLAPVTLLANILVYVGLNRVGTFNKSPLVPYVLFAFLFDLATIIVAFVLLAIF